MGVVDLRVELVWSITILDGGYRYRIARNSHFAKDLRIM